MDRKDFNSSKAHATSKIQVAKLAMRQPKGQFVDSQAFRLDYWPRLPHVITSHISVDLVFAEIMGVIKGSTSSRESLKPLSREDYLNRSTRLAPNFQSEADRSRVYEAFQAYEALKIASEDEDHVDRVVKLLRAIRGDPQLRYILTATFEEVYIDGMNPAYLKNHILNNRQKSRINGLWISNCSLVSSRIVADFTLVSCLTGVIPKVI